MRQCVKYISFLCILGSLFVSCKDEESYADKKKKERKAVEALIARRPLLLFGANNDTLLNIPGINTISQEQFEAQGCTTDVDKNEFVLFANKGIYMQIVRPGVGEKLKNHEKKQIICRYWEYNILADSLQSTNKTPYWASNPDIMNVDNNSGTISASFNTENGGGAMYMLYGETTVPSGWILPLTYVNIGRQRSDDEGIALVRLIVPHSEGTTMASSNVYPCFYEISYVEVRD